MFQCLKSEYTRTNIAGFTENHFVNATKKILRTRTQPRTFHQGPGPGPECQGQGLELQVPGPGL